MKKYIFLILIFTFLPLVTALDQIEIVCYANEELQILCLGTDELSTGIFTKVVESNFFIKQSFFGEGAERLGIGLGTFYIILIIGIFFLISLFLIMLVLLDKKRKRKV